MQENEESDKKILYNKYLFVQLILGYTNNLGQRNIIKST